MKTTKMSRAVMPSMTNHKNVLFGGELMKWMDEVSGIAAKRFAQSDVSTVAVEQVKFYKPIPLGEFVDVVGTVAAVGNTSLRVQVTVMMDGEPEQEEILAAEAVFVYVALNDEGKPRKVERKL